MRSSRTPAIATWLLQQFGCSARNDEVLGDLEEHFLQGRSRGWYWIQALTAIATSWWEEICNDKLKTGRALFVGWSITLIYTAFFAAIRDIVFSQDPRKLHSLFARELWNDAFFYPKTYLIVLIGTAIAGFTAIGAILAVLYRPQHRAAVLAFVITFLSWTLVMDCYRIAVAILTPAQPHLAYGVLLAQNGGVILDSVGVLLGAGFFVRRPFQSRTTTSDEA